MNRPVKIFLVAGEHSGDALGAKLMSALTARLGHNVSYEGVGGPDMAREGLRSLFPLEDVAVMGPFNIAPKLPKIVRRVYQTVNAAIVAKPDCVVIIDSPEFTHPIAKRIRRRAPHIPIVDYVSPSVWAWRPGRAKRMRAYVDHVLALLPFEPEAHGRLGGPLCTYVGHPLAERIEDIRTVDADGLARRLGLKRDKPVLLVLPGSRVSEVTRLFGDFGGAVAGLRADGIDFETMIVAVPHVREHIERRATTWAVSPHIVSPDEKYAAMRLATAALAASGTVTLELALAGTPSVVAYKVDAFAALFRGLVKVPSIVLANLVLGDNVYPEYFQENCTPDGLAAALLPLLAKQSPARRAQTEALARIPQKLTLPQGTPSEAAADAVVHVLAQWHRA